MARKRPKVNSKNTTVQGPTYVYVDNVPYDSASMLAGSGGDTAVYNAATLNLPVDTPDPSFFSAFSKVVTMAGATGIVLTADRGKGDKGMINAISQHELNGNVCTIMVSVQGGDNIRRAYGGLSTAPGFRNVSYYTKTYSKIVLSKDGSSLVVNAFRRNGGKHIVRRVSDIFEDK